MKPSAASSVLEILESRLAPAGLVTLSLTPAGALTLTGDALANDLQITDVGGGFWNIAPTAGGTTLFRMNGGPALAAITFAAPLSVTGNLGAGNDVAELSGLNVAKTLTLNGNDGNDSILLSGVGIGGAAVVDTGAGNDDVDFTSTDFFSTSTVRMGTGADYFTAGGDLFFGRGLNVDLGTGQNTFDVNAVTLQSNGALSAVGGGTAVEAQAFILATGTGVVNGALTLRTSTASPTTFEIGSQAGDSLQITGAMTLQSGTGTDNVILREALRVGGTLGISLSNGANSVQTGDLITLNAGHLSYTGGTGQDSVTFASDTVNVTGNLSFNGGAGTNLLDLNPAVSLRIGGGLSYSGSTGNDTLLIDGPDAMIGGLVNMNASSGNNALGFDATVGSAGALTYLGGAGNDVVDVGENSGASSLITIRGNTSIGVGAGSSDVQVRDTIIYGTLNVSTSVAFGGVDTVQILDSDVDGAMTLNMLGYADSDVIVRDTIFGSTVTVNTGSGDDYVAFDTDTAVSSIYSVFHGTVRVNLGAGNDIFAAGSTPAVATVGNDFNSYVDVNGGTGYDRAYFMHAGYNNGFNGPLPWTYSVEEAY